MNIIWIRDYSDFVAPVFDSFHSVTEINTYTNCVLRPITHSFIISIYSQYPETSHSFVTASVCLCYACCRCPDSLSVDLMWYFNRLCRKAHRHSLPFECACQLMTTMIIFIIMIISNWIRIN